MIVARRVSRLRAPLVNGSAWRSTIGARGFAESCAFTQFEHERWEAAVSPYDKIFGRLTAQAAAQVVDCALARSGGVSSRGLDCASGPGYVIEEALKRGVAGSSLVANDFSSAMLRRAKERVTDPSVTWFEADIQEPLPSQYNASFSWCACNFGVLHLARPEAFFVAARQALKPGGTLVFTVWAELSRSPAFQIPLGALEEHGTMDVGLPPGPPFFKYSSAETASKALVEAGFEPSSIQSEVVDMQWSLDRLEDLWEVFSNGTARTGGMLERQEPGAKARIEAAMKDAVLAAQQSRESGPPYTLTQPCFMVSAQTPC